MLASLISAPTYWFNYSPMFSQSGTLGICDRELMPHWSHYDVTCLPRHTHIEVPHWSHHDVISSCASDSASADQRVRLYLLTYIQSPQIQRRLTLLSTTRLSQRNWFIIRWGMLTPRHDLTLRTTYTARHLLPVSSVSMSPKNRDKSTNTAEILLKA